MKVELKNGFFIDGGGYIGDTTLILNKLNPKKIYSFEPIKNNLHLFKKTIALNNIHNVELIQKAIGDKKQILRINDCGPGSNIINKGNIKIEAISIDEFKKERKIKKIFFCKQKTAYEIYQCDWSSDVCSSDLVLHFKSRALIVFKIGSDTVQDQPILYGNHFKRFSAERVDGNFFNIFRG